MTKAGWTTATPPSIYTVPPTPVHPLSTEHTETKPHLNLQSHEHLFSPRRCWPSTVAAMQQCSGQKRDVMLHNFESLVWMMFNSKRCAPVTDSVPARESDREGRRERDPGMERGRERGSMEARRRGRRQAGRQAGRDGAPVFGAMDNQEAALEVLTDGCNVPLVHLEAHERRHLSNTPSSPNRTQTRTRKRTSTHAREK